MEHNKNSPKRKTHNSECLRKTKTKKQKQTKTQTNQTNKKLERASTVSLTTHKSSRTKGSKFTQEEKRTGNNQTQS